PHYGKALRAFDRFARSASVSERQRDCHSGGLNAERTDDDRQENKPAHPPRLRRAQDRTGHQLLGRDRRRLGQQGWQRLQPQTQLAAGERSRHRHKYLQIACTVYHLCSGTPPSDELPKLSPWQQVEQPPSQQTQAPKPRSVPQQPKFCPSPTNTDTNSGPPINPTPDSGQPNLPNVPVVPVFTLPPSFLPPMI